jgi:hypothetical protein
MLLSKGSVEETSTTCNIISLSLDANLSKTVFPVCPTKSSFPLSCVYSRHDPAVRDAQLETSYLVGTSSACGAAKATARPAALSWRRWPGSTSNIDTTALGTGPGVAVRTGPGTVLQTPGRVRRGHMAGLAVNRLPGLALER